MSVIMIPEGFKHPLHDSKLVYIRNGNCSRGRHIHCERICLEVLHHLHKIRCLARSLHNRITSY
jgi:hypothetical protein